MRVPCSPLLHFSYCESLSGTREYVLNLQELCQNKASFNPLNTELTPICRLLALLEAHHILHVSRIRVKALSLLEVTPCQMVNTSNYRFPEVGKHLHLQGRTRRHFYGFSILPTSNTQRRQHLYKLDHNKLQTAVFQYDSL